jgi:hypothetical protein
MARFTSLAALALLLAGTSCGGGDRPDFYVNGVGIVVRTDAPFARSPDFQARVEETVSAALAYWGGSWGDLDGRRISLLDGPYVPCGGSKGATGCYDGDLAISASDPGTGTFSCVEQTVLVHEVGHAVIGDPDHTDPRWMDFGSVVVALGGRLGYTAAGESRCEIFPSVWRHPSAR